MHKAHSEPYYRCLAREKGYSCHQKAVDAVVIDEQVVSILEGLKPSPTWRENALRSMGELLGEKKLEERLNELYSIIRQMGARWDNGLFLDEQEYFQKRLALQQEIEKLTPIASDDLEEAVNLLGNFGERYKQRRADTDKEHELVKMVVERVYIREQNVVAMTLKSNYHLVLGHKRNGSTEFSVDPFLSTSHWQESCQERRRRDLNPRPLA
jgi:hypothetical protein